MQKVLNILHGIEKGLSCLKPWQLNVLQEYLQRVHGKKLYAPTLTIFISTTFINKAKERQKNIQAETDNTLESTSNKCNLEKIQLAKYVNGVLKAPIPWV